MLELKHITFDAPASKSADGREIPGKRIINDFSLDIEQGKITVITGPNGGGKSTLARLIMGIEKPTSGRFLLDGEDITEKPIDERARLGIGYGFQTPARFKGMKVRKLITLASGRKISTNECNEYLSAVGLCSGNYLQREVDKSLSGGELKRIEIASVLARNPRVAIFDEPEAGIDLWSFDKLIDTFLQFHHAQPDHALVIISHQERIMQIADRIVVIKEGQLDREGPREEMMPTLMIRMPQNPTCGMAAVETTIGQWSLTEEGVR
ncbi:MAG: ATP-binding cassette domain-containing protein [Coriobacteriales bacterium]|nr:ATP-binding cassette domain-containing protein [Coriobacteriales bacterium]